MRRGQQDFLKFNMFHGMWKKSPREAATFNHSFFKSSPTSSQNLNPIINNITVVATL